jgi:hypothetical protein
MLPSDHMLMPSQLDEENKKLQEEIQQLVRTSQETDKETESLLDVLEEVIYTFVANLQFRTHHTPFRFFDNGTRYLLMKSKLGQQILYLSEALTIPTRFSDRYNIYIIGIVHPIVSFNPLNICSVVS